MTRTVLAKMTNFVVPGSGLVMLRREWLGLATAVLFTVFALIFIFATWITPEDIPAWAAYAALGGCFLVWIGSQWVVRQRARGVVDPVLADELEHLKKLGAASIASGDLEEAHRVLLVALNVHDEDAEAWLLWSQLMQRLEKRKAAAVGWRRVLQLSSDERHRLAAREGLGLAAREGLAKA